MDKTLKVLVIGAAGKTGKSIVEQALAAGHKVTAFVHNAGKYDVKNVQVIEGDAADKTVMEQAVIDQDVVIDAIGGKTPYKATTFETTIARTIIAAMRKKGVHRLIVTSMLGVGDKNGNSTFLIRLLLYTFLRGAKKDKAEMESVVKSSGLDWIILRPAILTDDKAKGNIKIFETKADGKADKITRSDLASFIIAQLSSDTYLNKTVTMANG